MTSRVDPRIARRRREVHDDRARSRMRRAIWLLALVLLVGVLAWVVRSPWFAVSTIAVEGVRHSDAIGRLTEAGVVEERPLLTVRTGPAVDAVIDDPWVVDAAITKLLPDTIEVVVIEREPGAYVDGFGGRALLASDGVVVPWVDGLPLGTIRLAAAIPEPGAPMTDVNVVGSLEFLVSLRADLARDAVVFDTSGELWAEVGGFEVRLGRPIDMSEKAAALQAVVDLGQPEGAIINVIAPTRPTVTPPSANPQGQVEG